MDLGSRRWPGGGAYEGPASAGNRKQDWLQFTTWPPEGNTGLAQYSPGPAHGSVGSGSRPAGFLHPALAPSPHHSRAAGEPTLTCLQLPCSRCYILHGPFTLLLLQAGFLGEQHSFKVTLAEAQQPGRRQEAAGNFPFSIPALDAEGAGRWRTETGPGVGQQDQAGCGSEGHLDSPECWGCGEAPRQLERQAWVCSSYFKPSQTGGTVPAPTPPGHRTQRGRSMGRKTLALPGGRGGQDAKKVSCSCHK